MLMTAVIHPDAFDRAHFVTPGYRDQAEMLLRGVESNGLLIVDPNCRLLQEINNRVGLLSTKDGQQLQIRWEELQKKERRRLLIAERAVCTCSYNQSFLDTAKTVQAAARTDTLVVDSGSETQLLAAGVPTDSLTSLGSYISSTFERTRHSLLDQMLPIDKLPPGEFDGHMVRVTRFAKRLRFYDKQIGNGSSLGGFRLGIGRILTSWLTNAHYPRKTFSVEVYTCVQKTIDPTDVVYNKILDSLVRRLAADHGVKIVLYFKEDSPMLTHDRYLQTDSVPVSFSKGFDYMEANGTLHRCAVKIDNGAYEHLQDFRGLRDVKPPAS